MSITTFPVIKTIVFAALLLLDLSLFGQSFVIGEPKGILNKLIIQYKQAEQIGDDIIIDVEIKQEGDTTIFCIGKFKEASDIFLCLPSAIYQNGGNYVFVKTGSENYFSFNEAYIKFIYCLAAKFTRLNLKVASFSPFVSESIDKITIVGGDVSDYTWYWYYVVNFSIIKMIRTDTSLYSTCTYGGE
ncbi:MAG TPA: hypothetical protein PLY21_15925 [Spirochaetota bacterium]|nr:hypothetical protein [Spirochaetota bacterium]